MNREANCFAEIRERLSRIQIQPVAYKIIEIAKNDGVPVQSLGEVIATEPLLALRLLRLANLMAGLPQTLSTLPQAIRILGLDQLKALSLGISLFSSAPGPSKDRNAEIEDDSVALRQLWEHLVGCATLAGRIAAKVGRASPHLVFVAGFLHDIGRLLIYRYSKDCFVETMTVAAEKNIPLTEAETMALGMNHLELGELWSCKVDSPISLKQVIRYHPEPSYMLPDSVDDETRRVIAIVRLADLACESQTIGNGGDRGEETIELWTALNLRVEDWTDELQNLKQEIEAARELFGFRRENFNKALPIHRPMMTVNAESVSQGQKIAVNGQRGQVIPFPSRNDYSPKGGENASSKRLTILVVEDHGSLCELLSLYLIRHGYHVRTADNGQAALGVLSKEEIDLVLLDLMLPRVDGFAVLKHVRETRECNRPYIIVVSAGASEKDRNRVLELGANEYMPKPFHLTRLLERIQAVEKHLLS